MAYLPGWSAWLTGAEDAIACLRAGAPDWVVVAAIRAADHSHVARAARVAAAGRRLRRRLRARIAALAARCRSRLGAITELVARIEAIELQMAALSEQWSLALGVLSRRRRLYVVAAARRALR